ncbi:MAG: hypothetical protein V4732_02725 [Pseudomonadota bacterium]
MFESKCFLDSLLLEDLREFQTRFDLIYFLVEPATGLTQKVSASTK